MLPDRHADLRHEVRRKPQRSYALDSKALNIRTVAGRRPQAVGPVRCRIQYRDRGVAGCWVRVVGRVHALDNCVRWG